MANKISFTNLLLYLQKCGVHINMKEKPLSGEALLSVKFANLLKILTIEKKLKGLFFHISNEGNFVTKEIGPKYVFGKLLKSMGKLPGLPDYILARGDKCVCIELKTATGKLSESQLLFSEWCALHNIEFEILRDIEDAVPLLRKVGMID